MKRIVFFLVWLCFIQFLQSQCGSYLTLSTYNQKLWNANGWAQPNNIVSATGIANANATIANSAFNYDVANQYYHLSRSQIEYFMAQPWLATFGNSNSAYATDYILPNYQQTKTTYLQDIQAIQPRLVLVVDTWNGTSPWHFYDGCHLTMAEDISKSIHNLPANPNTNFSPKDILVGAYIPEVTSSFGCPTPYKIEDWVYTYFGDPIPSTPVYYCGDSMRYASGLEVNTAYFNPSEVTNMRLKQAQYWRFERAARYIDRGYEYLDLGVMMNNDDPGNIGYYKTVKAIRKYAAKNARRKFCIIAQEAQGE